MRKAASPHSYNFAWDILGDTVRKRWGRQGGLVMMGDKTQNYPYLHRQVA